MKIRLTEKHDLPEVMRIIHESQEYFRGAGIDQWQNGYPNKDVILSDIEAEESYVFDDEGIIVGTFMASFRGEPTYQRIEGGKWLTDGPYAVIHRIAMDNRVKGRGYAGMAVRFMENKCLEREIPVLSLRGDTHEDNSSMQRMFLKNGYVRCGTIYLENGSRRWAYEKVLHRAEETY